MKSAINKIFRAPAAALLIIGTLGVCLPAVGVAGAEPAMAVVKSSDLNLATASGKRTLERRTTSAIDKVCPLRGSVANGHLDSRSAYRECAQSVRNSVKQQLSERGGRPVAGT